MKNINTSQLRQGLKLMYQWIFDDDDYQWSMWEKVYDQGMLKTAWEAAISNPLMMPKHMSSDGSESYRSLTEMPKNSIEHIILKSYYKTRVRLSEFEDYEICKERLEEWKEYSS